MAADRGAPENDSRLALPSVVKAEARCLWILVLLLFILRFLLLIKEIFLFVCGMISYRKAILDRGGHMHKKIRTANEEIGNVVFLILFTIVWYAGLLGNILREGFQPFILIFLAAGLLLPFQAVHMVQKAVYYRRLHAQCVEAGHPQKGKIVNIVREYYVDSNSRNRQYITYYFLIIEVFNSNTGVSQRIKSAPYRIPLHKYLGAPYVKVYTDSTGWHHVIEDFQLKENRSEPGITLENPNIYLKDFNSTHPFQKVIVAVILIGMLLFVFGVFRK